MRKALIAILLCAAAALCGVSCEKYALPRLDLSNDTILAPLEGGEFGVTLTSNVRWMFDDGSIQDWIYLDLKYGNSDYVDVEYPLKVRVNANDTDAERKCDMTVTTSTLSRKLVVIQAGPETTGEDGEDATQE